MLLNYLTYYPWKEKTNFDAKILSGQKIHTIRKTNRGAKPGAVLSHGNSGRGYSRQEFLINHCTGTQEVELTFKNGQIKSVSVDGKPADWKRIAKNDGLTEKEFNDWFDGCQQNDVFKGFIIHWTNLKY